MCANGKEPRDTTDYSLFWKCALCCMLMANVAIGIWTVDSACDSSELARSLSPRAVSTVK